MVIEFALENILPRNKIKEIVFHIGSPKTATTTIQQSLSSYSKELEKNGVLYRNGHGLVQTIFYDILKRSDKSTLPDNIDIHVQNLVPHLIDLRNFIEDIESNDKIERVVISSEFIFEYCGPYKYLDAALFLSKLKEIFLGHIIKFVVYLRPQDEFLISLYRHKAEKKKVQKILQFYEEYKQYFNYLGILDNISRIFVRSEIIIVPFIESQMPYGPFIKFIDIVGLDCLRSKEVPNIFENRSLPYHLVKFNQAVFPFFTFIGHTVFLRKCINILNRGYYRFGGKGSGAIFLSKEERMNFMKKYSKDNSEIAKKYLRRKEGKLFNS